MRGTLRNILIGAALSTLPALAAQAQGLTGALVNVSARFPNVGTLFVDGGNKTVSNLTEYAAGSFAGYNPAWSVDISDSQFILATGGLGFPFGTATFNGFILQILNGPTIVSASVDAGSDFSPIGVSVVNGNQVQINYSSVTFSNQIPRSSRINIVTSSTIVPEPSTMALTGLGAFALLFATQRRRRQETT